MLTRDALRTALAVIPPGHERVSAAFFLTKTRQSTAARALGVSQATISHLVNGVRAATPAEQRKLAKVFGLTVVDLFGPAAEQAVA